MFSDSTPLPGQNQTSPQVLAHAARNKHSLDTLAAIFAAALMGAPPAPSVTPAEDAEGAEGAAVPGGLSPHSARDDCGLGIDFLPAASDRDKAATPQPPTPHAPHPAPPPRPRIGAPWCGAAGKAAAAPHAAPLPSPHAPQARARSCRRLTRPKRARAQLPSPHAPQARARAGACGDAASH
jgi:hypothetical protein